MDASSQRRHDPAVTSNVVLLDLVEGVATLTLNRPNKLNALVPEMFVAIRDHLADLRERSAVRCLILTGAGRSFCAGHDLTTIRAGEAAQARFLEAAVIDELEALPIPTVAKVRGHCLTGALELALACDLIVCAEDADFADTHTRWAIPPVWGMSVRLHERVGHSWARFMHFTGASIPGRMAATIGLALRAVPASDLDEEVAQMAREISAASAEINKTYKLLYLHHRGSNRADALEFERAIPFGIPAESTERLREF